MLDTQNLRVERKLSKTQNTSTAIQDAGENSSNTLKQSMVKKESIKPFTEVKFYLQYGPLYHQSYSRISKWMKMQVLGIVGRIITPQTCHLSQKKSTLGSGAPWVMFSYFLGGSLNAQLRKWAIHTKLYP